MLEVKFGFKIKYMCFHEKSNKIY